MKRVSFKVAKVIKEAGYPQEYTTPCYITEDCTIEYDAYYDGDMPIVRENRYTKGQYFDVFGYSDIECEPPRCYAPTYFEVWRWLWKEKHISIEPWSFGWCGVYEYGKVKMPNILYSGEDPEGAIIAAIDNLVNKDLIK